MRRLMLALAAATCLVATAKPAPAQDWPQQPIRVIVSFRPGGGADIIGRILADAERSAIGRHVSNGSSEWTKKTFMIAA